MLLPENQRWYCCGRSSSSRLTMSHLVEQPPPLHNNNNNCEEGEQSLPPPAGLNSKCWPGGLGKGDGGGGAARAAAASSALGAGKEGSPLVEVEDVRVIDSSHHPSGGVALIFLLTSLFSLLSSWVMGCWVRLWEG